MSESEDDEESQFKLSNSKKNSVEDDLEFDEILKQKGKGKGRGRKKVNNQGPEKGKKKKEDKMPDKTKFIAKAKKVKSKDSKEEEKHESLKSVRSELLEPMVNEGVRVEEVDG